MNLFKSFCIFSIIVSSIIFSNQRAVGIERILHPYNLNFELGVNGGLPSGWYMPYQYEQKGFRAIYNNKVAFNGSGSLELLFSGPDTSTDYASVFQTVDAKNYAGKKVKLKAAVKAKLSGDSSEFSLWIGSRIYDGEDGHYYINKDITSNEEWVHYEIDGQIEDHADVLNFGFMLKGNGDVFIDDVSFEIQDLGIQSINDDHKNLSHRNIENLTSFFKLYGLIRYFYPGMEAMRNNWNDFVLKGAEAVEHVNNDKELIDTLIRLFNPIAPGINIVAKENKKKFTVSKPKNALDKIVLSWLHIGADLGIEVKNFSSNIKNLYLPTRKREAPVIQIVNANEFLGKRIRFSAYAKTGLFEPEGQAQLWIGIDNKKDEVAVMKTNADNPIVTNTWKEYSIEADVPEDAKVIRLGLVMFGDGKVWFDDPELHISGDDKKNYIKNEGFEQSDTGDVVLSWSFPESAKYAGYGSVIIEKGAYKGKRSLMIFSDVESRILMPKINDTYETELTESVYLQMPLTLYMDSLNTLPRPSPDILPVSYNKEKDFVMDSRDRYSRFALTGIIWNIFRHFGINIDKNLNWDEILKQTLANAATDINDEMFTATLNIMAAEINDGQARVWKTNDDILYGFPFLWKIIDGKVFIFQTDEKLTDIIPGSEVLEINGKSIHSLIEEQKRFITGNTNQWKELRAIAELKTGNKDDTLNLKIINPSGIEEIHKASKNCLLTELTEKRPPQFYIIQDDFFYVDLTKITDRGMKNLVSEMKDKFTKSKAMIFDLRGFTTLGEDFLGMFLSNSTKSVIRKIPVFSKPGGEPCTYYKYQDNITAKNPVIKASLVFLIDERTSGGAEIIAALAKHYKLGVLVGRTTSGTADEVFGINLPGNFNASIVGMLVEMPDTGLNLQKGVIPEIEITPTVDGMVNGKDEILESVYGLFKK